MRVSVSDRAKLEAAQQVIARGGIMSGGIDPQGRWHLEAHRRSKSGKLVKYWEEDTKNTVTNDGKGLYAINSLQGYWSSATPPGYTASWIGLVSNSGSPSFAPLSDTLASHAGWTEIPYNNSSGYTNTTRILWVQDHIPISAGNGLVYGSTPAVTIANSVSPATFTVGSSNITVFGLFLCTDAVYNATHTVASTGTSGVLFCETALASPVTFNSTTTITAVYTVTIT